MRCGGRRRASAPPGFGSPTQASRILQALDPYRFPASLPNEPSMMLPGIRRYALATLGFGLGAARLPAHSAPIRDLPKAGKEIDDPFSLIVAAKEYRPGQLLVSDGVEGQVSLVDFAKRSE